jgi:MazG family protein
VAQTLANAYPADHLITVATARQEGPISQQPLHALLADRAVAVDNEPLMLCVPPLPEGSSFSALQAIVAYLRSPVGCPWDREQTLLSMRHDLLGECVEVLEAIDREAEGIDNSEHIAEELGDLFMAGVLTLQIAVDAGRFHLADAMRSIVTKLIRRHPHVFGDVAVDGVDAIWANWDAIKVQEKLAKGQPVSHPLDGVPTALPALEKARALQAKAQKAALLDRAALAATLAPALDEFQRATHDGQLTAADLGAFLWTITAVAQQADLNAEDALRSYCVQYKNQHQ